MPVLPAPMKTVRVFISRLKSTPRSRHPGSPLLLHKLAFAARTGGRGHRVGDARPFLKWRERVLHGTATRDPHSCLWRSHSLHVHVAHFSLSSASRRCGFLDSIRFGAGVTYRRSKETIYAGDESSGPCCRWRIARPCRSERSRASVVAQQSRCGRSGSAGCSAGCDRGAMGTTPWLAPRMASPPPPSLAPLVSAAFHRT